MECKDFETQYESDPEWTKAIEHMANLIREWVDSEILKSMGLPDRILGKKAE